MKKTSLSGIDRCGPDVTYATVVKGKKRRGSGTRYRQQKEQPGGFDEAFKAVSFLCLRPKRHRSLLPVFYAHRVGSLALLPRTPSIVDSAHCRRSSIATIERGSIRSITIPWINVVSKRCLDSRSSLMIVVIDFYEIYI